MTTEDAGVGLERKRLSASTAMAAGVLLMGSGATTTAFCALARGIGPGAFRWLLAVAGCATCATGGAILAAARRERAEAVAALRALRELPEQPWLADYPWDPSGIRANPFPAALRRFFLPVLLAALACPLFRQAFVASPVRPVYAVAACNAAAIVAFAFSSTWNAALEATRFGRVDIRFRRFPFFLGETLEADLSLAGPKGGNARVDVRLECIQETAQGYSARSWTFRTRSIWGTSRTVEGPAASLRISLPLARGPEFRTVLAARPRRFWLLHVTGEGDRAGSAATFVVPVYMKRGGSARSAPAR